MNKKTIDLNDPDYSELLKLIKIRLGFLLLRKALVIFRKILFKSSNCVVKELEIKKDSK